MVLIGEILEVTLIVVVTVILESNDNFSNDKKFLLSLKLLLCLNNTISCVFPCIFSY